MNKKEGRYDIFVNKILTIIFLIILSLTTSFSAFALTYEDVLKLGLPIVVVQTDKEEEPTCDYVDAPLGSVGKSIANATKVPGSVEVYSPENELLYSSGEYEKGESGMTIKIRGNTSAYGAKKPFKIKLQKKGDLLGRNNKDYNDKNWALLNDNEMKLIIGFNVSRFIGQDWTPDGMYVNLIMNGDYRGLYYLVESIERNEKCRINVSDTGFVIEHDAYWWNEDNQYLSSIHLPILGYTFKFPDFEDIKEEELERYQEIVEEYETSLSDGSYMDKIELESFAKWILAHDILGTWDGAGSNFYLTKYDINDESKIKAGPLWDFDTIEKIMEDWSSPHTGNNRFDGLFQGKQLDFREAYVNLWEEKRSEIYKNLISLIDSFNDLETWNAYNNSVNASNKRWSRSHPTSSFFVKDTKEWFEKRFKWLHSNIEELKKEMDYAGIEQIEDSHSLNYRVISNGLIPNDSGIMLSIYGVDGQLIRKEITQKDQPVTVSNPGIYIFRMDKDFVKIRVK